MTLQIDENYFRSYDKSPQEKKIRLWVEEGGCGVVATNSKEKKILAAWSISKQEINRWDDKPSSFVGRTWEKMMTRSSENEQLLTFQRFLKGNPKCHLHLVGFTCIPIVKLGIEYYHEASPLTITKTRKIVFEVGKDFRYSRSRSKK